MANREPNAEWLPSGNVNHVFSFGGGATSFLGALKAIEAFGFDNVEVINAALLDDEPYILPVIEAFERVSGKSVRRISYQSERLHLTAKAVNDAYEGNITPKMLRWLLERINTNTSGRWQAIEVATPLYSTWHVDFMSRFMSNSLVDPCSSNLKRKPIGRYIKERFEAGTVSIGVAMTADEIDRTMSVTKRWQSDGYTVAYPLMADERYCDKAFVIAEFERLAGFVPSAYQMELSHNNCTPCRKGGKAHHAKTLYYRREAYMWSERHEKLWRDTFQKHHTVLRDFRGGTKSYMTMEQFRIEQEERWQKINVLPGMEHLMFFGLKEAPSCTFCESSA